VNKTITIKPDDTISGRRKDPCYCPIALAARRAGIAYPWVGGSWIEGEIGGVFCTGRLPGDVVSWITWWDWDQDTERPRVAKPESFRVEFRPYYADIP